MNYLVICWLALDERGPFLSKQASYDFHCWFVFVCVRVCVWKYTHAHKQTRSYTNTQNAHKNKQCTNTHTLCQYQNTNKHTTNKMNDDQEINSNKL